MAASECGFRASLALLFVSALTLGAARQRSLVPQMCSVTVAKRTLPYSGSGHSPPRGHYIMCSPRLVDADVPARGPGALCGLSVFRTGRAALQHRAADIDERRQS